MKACSPLRRVSRRGSGCTALNVSGHPSVDCKDRSVPIRVDTTLGDAPGTIEERKYRVPDNGAKYDGFISSSISAPR